MCIIEGKIDNPHLDIIILKIINVGGDILCAKNFTYLD